MNQSQQIMESLGEAEMKIGDPIPKTDFKRGDTVTVDMAKVDSKAKSAVEAEVKKGGGKVKVVGMAFGKIIVLAEMPKDLRKSGGPMVPPNALKKG